MREHGIGYTVHTNGESGQVVCDGIRQIFLDWAAGRNATIIASTTTRARFAEHAKRSTLPRSGVSNGNLAMEGGGHTDGCVIYRVDGFFLENLTMELHRTHSARKRGG